MRSLIKQYTVNTTKTSVSRRKNTIKYSGTYICSTKRNQYAIKYYAKFAYKNKRKK